MAVEIGTRWKYSATTATYSKLEFATEVLSGQGSWRHPFRCVSRGLVAFAAANNTTPFYIPIELSEIKFPFIRWRHIMITPEKPWTGVFYWEGDADIGTNLYLQTPPGTVAVGGDSFAWSYDDGLLMSLARDRCYWNRTTALGCLLTQFHATDATKPAIGDAHVIYADYDLCFSSEGFVCPESYYPSVTDARAQEVIVKNLRDILTKRV